MKDKKQDLEQYNAPLTTRQWIARVTICVGGLLLIYNLVFEDSIKYRRRKYIVVLGGGVTPYGGLPKWVLQRACKAEKLFHKSNKLATVVTLSRGTPHKPNPLDRNGYPIYESSATAKHMLEVGVPPEKLIEEGYSLDTVGNAYFLRTMHMDSSNVRKMIVVTNKFHMPRTKAIFDKVFSLPPNAYSFYGCFIRIVRTVFFLSPTWPFQITYEEAPNGMDGDTLFHRGEKEQKSHIEFLMKTTHEFYDMQSAHKWIFKRHEAYKSTRLEPSKVPVTQLDAETLKTY